MGVSAGLRGEVGTDAKCKGISNVSPECGSGDEYPRQRYEYTDAYNGDLVSALTHFKPYGSSAICNWKIPLEVSSNASRPFCGCGTSDEIENSYINFTWDSSKGDVYSPRTEKYMGGTQERYSDSDFNYEDYAEVAVDYGVNKLLELVPYGSELQAAAELLYAMYENYFGSKNNNVESTEIELDWQNVTREVNQVSYWNKAEAVLGPDESMNISITDKTDPNKPSGDRLIHSFDEYVSAPPDCPSSTSLSADTPTKIERNGWIYFSVPRNRVAADPLGYGLSKDQLDRAPGENIIFAYPI